MGEDTVRFLNGNIGVFFYERDLWYPEELKKRLIKIVQAIDTLSIPLMVTTGMKVVQPKAPKKRGKIKLVYED